MPHFDLQTKAVEAVFSGIFDATQSCTIRRAFAFDPALERVIGCTSFSRDGTFRLSGSRPGKVLCKGWVGQRA
jgi:hypothetical protein